MRHVVLLTYEVAGIIWVLAQSGVLRCLGMDGGIAKQGSILELRVEKGYYGSYGSASWGKKLMAQKVSKVGSYDGV